MAAIEAPQTAAASNTEVDSDYLNPSQDWNENIVHITLKFEGVTFDPNGLYDALDSAYGTVYAEKGAGGNSRGTYIFKITA